MATLFFTILGLGICVTYWRPGQGLFGDVLLRLFHPYMVFFRESLRQGSFPLWNPFIYSGVPFFANIQTGLLYPTTWLGVGLPFSQALLIDVFFHVFWAGLGMYCLARLYGTTFTGGLLAGAIFAANGFFIGHLSFPSQIHVLTWTPWVLCLTLQSLRPPHPQKAIAGAVLVCTLQVFGGHPQFVIYTWMALGIALLFFPAPGKIKLKNTLLILSFTLALTALQWVPFLNFWWESNRKTVLGIDLWQGGYSLSPKEFLYMLVRPFWDTQWTPSSGDPHIVGVYFGWTTLLLLLLGMPKMRRTPFNSFGVWAGMGLWLALGSFAPGFDILRKIPPFSLFRFPAQALVFLALSVSLLAALGFDGLKWKKIKIFLFALVLVDFWGYAVRIHESLSSRLMGHPPLATQILQDSPSLQRVFVAPRTRTGFRPTGANRQEAWEVYRETLMPNIGMAYDIEDIDGYEEMRYSNYDGVLDKIGQTPQSNWLNILGVSHILSAFPLSAPFPLKAHIRGIGVYENPTVFPRAYFVSKAENVNRPDIIAVLEEWPRDFWKEKTALETPTENKGGPSAPPQRFPPVTWERPSPNEFKLKGWAPEPGYVVCAESFASGWTASLNGVTVPVLRANGFQRAVKVPPGNFQIHMTYRPRAFFWGGILSLGCSVVLLIGLIVSRIPFLRGIRVRLNKATGNNGGKTI